MSSQLVRQTVRKDKRAQSAVSAPKRAPSRCCVQQVRNLRLPRALQLPVCVRPIKRALAAAKAPECLQRSLQQYSKPPRKLAITCAWAEESVPEPHLLPEPLFGTCLEDVLQATLSIRKLDQISETKRAELQPYPESLPLPHPGQPASARDMPGSVPAPRPRPGRPPRSVQTVRSGLQVFTRPTRAGVELLARRAGGYRIISQLSGRPKGPRRLASLVGDAGLLAGGRSKSGAIPVSGSFLGWLRRLEHRFGRRFGQGSDASGNMNPTSFAESSADVAENTPGWIVRALAVEPAGPEVSLKMLLRLVGATETLPEHSSARSRPPNLAPGTMLSELLSSPAERTASGVPAWDAPFSATPRGEAPSPVLQSPTGGQQGFYPQAGALSLPAAGQPNFRPLIAPPLATDALPTLLSPQTVFDAPTPYASAMARQAARHDEVSLVEEDLDVLAAKIRRILDDEARRNGIQV